MAIWIALPILAVLTIFQTVVVSRIELLHGTANFVMLTVIAWALQNRVRSAWYWGIIGGLFLSLATALPFYVPITGMLLIVAIAMVVKRRVWQVPILGMFAATFVGTIILHTVEVVALRVLGISFSLQEVISSITLPSLLLNLIVAAPVYYLVGDLAKWVYPEVIEA
jgi:rod shape-determining protein MreD